MGNARTPATPRKQARDASEMLAGKAQTGRAVLPQPKTKSPRQRASKATAARLPLQALDPAIEATLQSLADQGYPNCADGLRYAEMVNAGLVPVCKWIKLACERHARDLARIGSRNWDYEVGSGMEAAERMMRNMQMFREVKGPRAGMCLTFGAWQKFIYFSILAWVHKDTGARRFRYALAYVPRGNGKTTMVAPLGLGMLALDGEGGAEIYAAAVTRQQAKLVFDVARFMAVRERDFCSRFDITVNKRSIDQAVSASSFTALSRDSSSMDGLNVYLAILDELAQHKNRETHDLLVTATGKRSQSLIFAISTASSNQSGIGYEQWKYAKQVLEGKIKDEQLFAMLYTIDEGDDWTLESTHIKANPNWGVSVVPAVIKQLCEKAQQIPAAQNSFKQKHLNVWTNAAISWMNMQLWRDAADTMLAESQFAGMECVMALDLASKIDLAAKVKLFRREVDGIDHYYVFADFWVPQATIDNTESTNSNYAEWVEDGWLSAMKGETNDFNVIEQSVRGGVAHADDDTPIEGDAQRFIIEDVAYDPWQALQMATNLDHEGIPVIEYRPTVANFSPAMKEIDALIREGRLHHDGNPVLEWCVSCTLVAEDQKGNIYPRKDKADKTQKIDGLVALLMAMGRRMAIDNDGQEPSLSFVG